MDDALWKLAGFLLAAILVFMVPTMAMLERQDDVTQSLVQAETNRFADTARDMGAISPQLYERFSDRLSATGLHYDIRIRHQKRSWIPVYATTTSGLSFTGDYGQSRITDGEQSVLGILYPSSAAGVDDVSRQYRMHAGDLLFVEVESRGETMAGSLRRMLFFRPSSGMGIFARAGGMVRNEAD
jgi:hypothetical protein